MSFARWSLGPSAESSQSKRASSRHRCWQTQPTPRRCDMSTSPGMNLAQLAADSLLRSKREHYFAPEAVSVNKLVASVDPSSAVTVGTALTLQTAASVKLLRRARRPTLVLTDASGGAGGLSVTVKFVGSRWGQYLEETVTCTCTDGNATTATAANCFDEITQVMPLVKTSTGSGDALTCGIDGTSFGLDWPIDFVEDVQ